MKIHYTVSMDEPGTHYFRVVMTLEGLRGAVPSDLMKLAMPVWTPGSYLVREFARNVLELDVVDGSGNEVHAQKEAKDSWGVELRGSDKLVVTYRVYAFRHNTNQSYLDSDHAIINGASVFLYLGGHQSHPVTVEIVPHPGWKVVTTGLEPLTQGGWTFAAPNYDVLIDSPIEVGNQHVHSFEVQGVKHEVSIFAPKPIDEATFVADIKKIVEHTIPIYGEVPYPRYVFLVDFTDQGYDGLEHLNSTHCIASYYMMEPPGEYRQMLSLFSHEFFHAWNVKRMRPKALGPFDYSVENYTKSLWIAEGLTSYYEDIILRRAGIVSVPEYLDFLCGDINQIKSFPSSRWQSPQESSFDAWIKFYRQDENTPNVSASYYRQGAVVGTLLDLEIRRSTGSGKTLDDVLRTIYRETYREGRGFTDEEFELACSEISHGSTDEIFSRYVRGRDEIDFQRYLGYAGLMMQPKTTFEVSEGFLGVKVKPSPGLTVTHRLFGSPAEVADISAGDEIIAVDGLRMDGPKLSFYIANRRPGSEVSVIFAREGVIRQTTARLTAKQALEYRVQKKESASAEEKDLFRSWTLSEWDAPLQYQEHRTSPARTRQLDYL
ncbi:MAG: PDZ domain-containing protein [Thaumarchaeota archaeon]|nr:PDZ domain-containing protein [Nitrososphaerota archaeon]